MKANLRGLWLSAVLVLWLGVDVSWATHRMFQDITKIGSAAAAAYASLLALPAVYIAFFEWARRRDTHADRS